MATAGAYFAWYPRDPQVYSAGAISYPEAATQTFKRGTPVVLDSNGRIAAAGASFTLVFGVAAEPGHNAGAGANNVLVYQLKANQQWAVSLDTAITQNQFGVAAGDVGFVADSTTGFWYATTSDTQAQARLVDYVQGPAGGVIGDTKMPVFVEFHTTKLQVV